MNDKQKVADLVYRLGKQYPSGVTTISPCPKCEKPSRGGDLCSDCLTDELGELTGQHQVARDLQRAIKDLRDYTDMLMEPDYE